MRAFLEPLNGLVRFGELEQALSEDPGMYAVWGCTDAQKPHMIYGLGRASRGARLIVTFGEQKARELLEACRFFYPTALYFPAKDILFYQSDIRGNALTKERMRVYRALFEEEEPVVVTTMDALMDRLIPPQVMESFRLHLKRGGEIYPDGLRRQLVCMGYEHSSQVREPGQFSVRGGILDVFPMTEDMPFRIELLGDEIDSIRGFNPESQRSLEARDRICVYPASELVLDREKMETGLEVLGRDAKRIRDRYRGEMKTEEAFRVSQAEETVRAQLLELSRIRQAEGYLTYFYEDTVSFLEYFSRGTAEGTGRFCIFVDEPLRCLEAARAVEREFLAGMRHRAEAGYVLPREADMLLPAGEVAARIGRGCGVFLSSLEMTGGDFSPRRSFYFQVKSVNSYQGKYELLLKDLRHYKKLRYSAILLCASGTRARRLSGDLQNEGLNVFCSEDADRTVQPGEVMIRRGVLGRGFEYPDVKFVVLTETDIFGADKKKKRSRKTFRGGNKITSFDELKAGDYVIHENHGVGIFRGIEKIEVDKTAKDYIKIEYSGGGMLYVVVTQLDLIQKYADSSEKKPKLNRLGAAEWKKTRGRVRGAVRDIARDLVNLYAVRQNSNGYRYGEDTVWQTEFEETFPYVETEDQLQAIRETKEDMESAKIMDRLLCGDVGFGKTEVAIRAAFKAVQEDKQVVYLVPTTILAQQHYNNFVQRLKDFPVSVELLCRFRTQAQQKNAIKNLGKGLVDIVVGTHRVLSKDVRYRDLGLLIIDEEQRFGVSHKEKIKQMKKTVDVLSLSATPIPRTLHMSMIGIRDMSVLEQPPEDRMPIQTYVMEYNEEMVREAIERELARNGQVYYVYNRVEHIADMRANVSRIVPDARVAFAHGRMRERDLEDVMYQFINGQVDVLVSTTIIETGLDIGNVNTMIVHDADRMGLAQLYQLRGRIGRSNRTAYAFLMYRKDKMLRETAEKRLSAIRDFTELGSGIRIAMRDLEIRGAGNILGEQQHGHIEAVGYELYCKMLGEAVKDAKGEEVEESFETSIDIELDAYIPSSYIADENQKLDIYRKIAAIRDKGEKEETEDELADRFGSPPCPVQNLLMVSQIRAEAHRLFITEIKEEAREIFFYLFERAKLDTAKIPDLITYMSPRLHFVPDKKKPCFVCRKDKKGQSSPEVIRQVLQAYRDICMGESSRPEP